MTPSSPESLTSSFVSLSLSQARSYPPESSGEDSEFIVLERSTPPHLSPSISSAGGARGGRNATSESTSSGFSLVQAQEADQEESEENEVELWLRASPARPSRGPSTPVSSSHHSSGRLEHQGGSISSSSEHGDSSASGSQVGTSRRAKQRVRARALAAQSRREAAAAGRGLGISPPSSSSSNYEVGPTRPWADESSEREDEDEVDSVLGSEFTEEGATEIVDNFLANSAVFMLQGDNGKLQLWQALCVELGLCLPPNSSSYASTTSTSSRSRSNSTHSSSSSDSDRTTSAYPRSRSVTPTQDLYHPFPTSLTQANKLLKAYAFVNLREYFATRIRVGDGMSSQGGEGSVGGLAGYGGDGSESGGRSRVTTEEGRKVRNAALASLRHPNKNALRRYTQKNRLYVKLGAAKEAWLQPLLIDMFFPSNQGGRA